LSALRFYFGISQPLFEEKIIFAGNGVDTDCILGSIPTPNLFSVLHSAFFQELMLDKS
jgi:hypothetical protein